MVWDEIMLERKEKIKSFIERKDYVPLKRKELASLLDVPAEDRSAFEEIIQSLLDEGFLVETKKGKLILASSVNIVAGIFIGNAKGFGFVQTEDPKQEDIFIPAKDCGGAMNKDKVLCKITSPSIGQRRAEGQIIRILEQGQQNVVGTFMPVRGYGFVVPDDKKIGGDIYIPQGQTKGAVEGHKVVAEIVKRPEGRQNAEGKIIEILGHVNDPGVDILSIIRQFELPEAFPDEVYQQIEDLPEEVDQNEAAQREDLRSLVTVTIDGEDAKDLDDAVSIEVTEDGMYRLGVHIADVSHYVKEQTPLDQEAVRRGTSIYLVDRVIPMLPHKLSNGICSLNPDVDRLTLSCFMDIDHKGDVIRHRITKSIIRSKRRMTYTAVKKILEDQDPAVMEQYKELVPVFQTMKELRDILNDKRVRRGSVNFDLPESKIILDEKGKPVDILPYDRNVATSIIEEFMLVCNETIAEEYFWLDLPFVFRNHEAPDEEKMKALKEFIQNFGYHLKGKGEIHPKAVAQVLKEAQGKVDERIISRVVLRSMKQAKYMGENLGHFGLAAKYYCHFTSPIRRYPDLQIHRIIKENLDGKMNEKRIRHYGKIVPEVAKLSSQRERLAEEAERETDKLKKAEYMADKIGCQYEGVISGLTSRGIYVELYNTVEGMVSMDQMTDDQYFFDEANMMYIGKHRRKTYRLGDVVQVEVVRADTELRIVDFLFVADEKEEQTTDVSR